MGGRNVVLGVQNACDSPRFVRWSQSAAVREDDDGFLCLGNVEDVAGEAEGVAAVLHKGATIGGVDKPSERVTAGLAVGQWHIGPELLTRLGL